MERQDRYDDKGIVDGADAGSRFPSTCCHGHILLELELEMIADIRGHRDLVLYADAVFAVKNAHTGFER